LRGQAASADAQHQDHDRSERHGTEQAELDVLHPSVVPDQPRILVAEDDDDMRRLVTEALTKDGYDVFAIADGNGLLAALDGCSSEGAGSGGWDLVVSDVRMPGCSGLRILEEVRAANGSVPFILMTAFGDAATHERVRALGALLFDKPFDVTKLRTAVASLLWR
jgi:DNA-binding response OmpR family regulator